MLRLLGILSLGNLLLGGRRHRRALRRGLLLGVILGLFAGNNPEMERVTENVRKGTKDINKAVRHAVRKAKKEIRHARRAYNRNKDEEACNSSVPESNASIIPVSTVPAREVAENREILKDLEQNARTAAMMANVPTIDFPEDDVKYHSARKYGYA